MGFFARRKLKKQIKKAVKASGRGKRVKLSINASDAAWAVDEYERLTGKMPKLTSSDPSIAAIIEDIRGLEGGIPIRDSQLSGGPQRRHRWGVAEGYDPELHDGMPFDFSRVPIEHVTYTGEERVTSYVIGGNARILREHLEWLDRFIGHAREVVPELHPGFHIPVDAIPMYESYPPRDRRYFPGQGFEVPVLTPAFSFRERTKTGRLPKYPLTIGTVLNSHTRERDGLYFVMSDETMTGDEAGVTIDFFVDGSVGKARLDLWRNHVRWGIHIVRDGDEAVIARIEEKHQSWDKAVRHYDYRA